MTIHMEIVALCVLLLLALTCTITWTSNGHISSIYPKQSNQYINSINWFDGNEGLIWMDNNGKIKVSSNISHHNTFLPHTVDLCDQLYDVMYLDSINDKIYAIDSISLPDLRILYYDLKTKDMMDIYHCAVDANGNTIYFASPYGLFYFNSTTLEIEQLSLTYNYSSYNVHKLAIYEDYLYVSAFSIGIIRLQLSSIHTHDTKVNNADVYVLINDKSDIMSFGTDIDKDIMYFSTENKIYNFNISDKTYSLFDAKINSSMIYALQLNYDGTMLFIQYKQDDYVYVINWPTDFGCVLCKPKAKLLYSTKLAVTKRMQSCYHVHSKHASSRKLLLNFDTWKTSNITLSRSDAAMAGYYNNTIFLLGVKDYSSQVVEFNVVDNKIIDNGLNVLPTRTYGYGQFYTQINELIFTIDSTGGVLSTYNMNTKTFEYNCNVLDIPNNVLADNYLFILGGSNGDWHSNFDDFQAMEYGRQRLTCNVHPITKELYAIGGYQDNYQPHYFVTKIEKIYINGNISNQTWKELNDNLLPTRQLRLVIGDYELKNRKNTAALLEYPVSLTASIIVNHMIYAFAGSTSNGNVNTRLTIYVSSIYCNSSFSTNIGMDNYSVSNQHWSIIHQGNNVQTMTCTNINQVVSPANINPLTVLTVRCEDNILLICNSSLSCDNMNINKIKHTYNDYKIICQSPNACQQMIVQQVNINITMIMYEYSGDNLLICGLISFFYNTIIKLLRDYFSYTHIKYFNVIVNKTIIKSENINANSNAYYTSFKITATVLWSILIITNTFMQHKEDVKKLKNKIQNLEAALSKYKNILTENSKTVSVLKNTIQKIQTERDEATQQIEVLNKNNGKHKRKSESLKNQNIELKSLAGALVINLARKEQSLEEALDAIHSLNGVNEQMTNGDDVEYSKSVSLTDILEMHSHSNVNLEDDESGDDDKDVYENVLMKQQSFTKGIARRLRKSLTQLTEAKKSQ